MMPTLTCKLDTMAARKGTTSESVLGALKLMADLRLSNWPRVRRRIIQARSSITVIWSRGCDTLYDCVCMRRSIEIGMTTMKVIRHHVISNFSQNIICEDL